MPTRQIDTREGVAWWQVPWFRKWACTQLFQVLPKPQQERPEEQLVPG